ncbi:hypothetical protein BJX99DRAFT_254062 [Aspergillus californicus]
MSSGESRPAVLLCDDVLREILKHVALDYINHGLFLPGNSSLPDSIDVIRATEARNTIYNLALTSREFHSWVRPILYQSVLITNYRQHSLLFRTLQEHPDLVPSVKSFVLAEPAPWGDDYFNTNDDMTHVGPFRCFRAKTTDYTLTDEADNHPRLHEACIPSVVTLWDIEWKRYQRHGSERLMKYARNQDQAFRLFAVLLLCGNIKAFYYQPSCEYFDYIFLYFVRMYEGLSPRCTGRLLLYGVEKIFWRSLWWPGTMDNFSGLPRLRMLDINLTSLGDRYLAHGQRPHISSSIRELHISKDLNCDQRWYIPRLITNIECLESLSYTVSPSNTRNATFYRSCIHDVEASIKKHSQTLQTIRIRPPFPQVFFLGELNPEPVPMDIDNFPRLSVLEVPSLMLVPQDLRDGLASSLVPTLPPQIEELAIVLWYESPLRGEELIAAVRRLSSDNEGLPELRSLGIRETQVMGRIMSPGMSIYGLIVPDVCPEPVYADLRRDFPVGEVKAGFAARHIRFDHELVERSMEFCFPMRPARWSGMDCSKVACGRKADPVGSNTT